MTEEASLTQTEHGTVPDSDGWFILNARESRWLAAPGRSAFCDFEGDQPFGQVGVNLCVLAPGEPMAMYHWEADQEDFLVLSGEPVLVIEGVERQLRPWDLVHCPPGTKHVIVGAGESQSVVVAIGARERSSGEGWGGYTVESLAQAHDASVEHDTTEPSEAYAGLSRRKPARYREGWLGTD